MKTIKCSCGKEILVDDAKFDTLKQMNWNCGATGGVVRSNNVTMSHLVMGRPLGSLIWDHKDRDQHNNQESNFRPATLSQNQANRGKSRNNTSGYKGVYWHPPSGKWQSRLMVNYKNVNLGLFNTAEEAAQRYDRASVFYHGEFAYVNFPSPPCLT